MAEVPTPEEIKDARKWFAMTQTAFGKALGVSLRTVQGWERGETPAPAMLSLALAAMYDGRHDAGPPEPKEPKPSQLVARTPAETAAFLAMIERQGVEAKARGERILAAYKADEERWAAEVQPNVVFDPETARVSAPVPGASLAVRIAVRTARSKLRTDDHG